MRTDEQITKLWTLVEVGNKIIMLTPPEDFDDHDKVVFYRAIVEVQDMIIKMQEEIGSTQEE